MYVFVYSSTRHAQMWSSWSATIVRFIPSHIMLSTGETCVCLYRWYVQLLQNVSQLPLRIHLHIMVSISLSFPSILLPSPSLFLSLCPSLHSPPSLFPSPLSSRPPSPSLFPPPSLPLSLSPLSPSLFPLSPPNQQDNPFASEVTKKPDNLPQNRSAYYGDIFSVESSSDGRLTYAEILEILNKRESETKESWTPERVADKYNIKPADAEQLMRYFSAYKTSPPEKWKEYNIIIISQFLTVSIMLCIITVGKWSRHTYSPDCVIFSIRQSRCVTLGNAPARTSPTYNLSFQRSHFMERFAFE